MFRIESDTRYNRKSEVTFFISLHSFHHFLAFSALRAFLTLVGTSASHSRSLSFVSFGADFRLFAVLLAGLPSFFEPTRLTVEPPATLVNLRVEGFL